MLGCVCGSLLCLRADPVPLPHNPPAVASARGSTGQSTRWRARQASAASRAAERIRRGAQRCSETASCASVGGGAAWRGGAGCTLHAVRCWLASRPLLNCLVHIHVCVPASVCLPVCLQVCICCAHSSVCAHNGNRGGSTPHELACRSALQLATASSLVSGCFWQCVCSKQPPGRRGGQPAHRVRRALMAPPPTHHRRVSVFTCSVRRRRLHP